MHERGDNTHGELSQSWNSEAVANALNTAPQPVRDIALGHGNKLDIGQDTTLEMYPEGNAARVTVGTIRIELFGQSAPTIDDRGVLFEQQHEHQITRLRIHAAGEAVLVAFSATPPSTPDAVERPLSADTVLPYINNQQDTNTALLGNSVPSETPLQQQRQPDKSTPEKEGKQRVALTGRVGKLPTIRETQKGLIAKFPVAEHHDDGSTTWHTVVAFGKRAAALQDNLTVGEEISLAGYLHERQTGTKRDGTPKTVREIYLAGLKRADNDQ